MDINKKITEIRNLPEQLKMRYVIISVAICMFFVFLIFILSIKNSFSGGVKLPAGSELPKIENPLETIKQTAPSLKQFAEDGSAPIENNTDEGITPIDSQTTGN